MSKPKIYGTCPAGCLWETIHKSDLDDGTIKATFDGAGNNIAKTYLPKSDRATFEIFSLDDEPQLSTSADVFIGNLFKRTFDCITAVSLRLRNASGDEYCYQGMVCSEPIIDDFKTSYDIFLVGGGFQTIGETRYHISGSAVINLFTDTGDMLFIKVKDSANISVPMGVNQPTVLYGNGLKGLHLISCNVLYI